MISTDVTRGIQMIKNGLKRDIDDLLERFEESKSLRYIDFACLWKEKSFNFIFTYKLNENDLRETIEEAFNIVLEPLCRETIPARRYSSLYFIYCVYTNQPIEPKVPIKLTISKHRFFREFLLEAKKDCSIDACYILLKLISLGAFHLVARSRTFGPLTIRNNMISSAKTSRELPIGLMENLEDSITKLEMIHTSYNNNKRVLEGDDLAEVRELNLVSDQLFREFERLSERTTPEVASQDEADAIVDADTDQFNV